MSDSSINERLPKSPVLLLDRYAAEEPDRPFALYPISSNPEDGFKPVTFKALANAVNFFAHEISALNKRARSDEEFPTIAYIGLGDVRYLIVLLACIKARCKAFFFSTRNSLAANLSLLKATKSVALIYADRFAANAKEWLKDFPMESLQAPSLIDCLTAEPTKPFPYAVEIEEAKWHPFVVLHTSGSTGIPKPLVVKHGAFFMFDARFFGRGSIKSEFLWNHWATVSRRPLLALPLFHVAGIANYVALGLYYRMTIVFPPSDKLLNSEIIIRSLVASKADGLIIAPSILEDMARTEEGIQTLAKLQMTGFGGSAMAQSVGDLLVQRGVKLYNLISSSENTPYHINQQKDPALWNWHNFNADSMGAEFRKIPDVAEPVYELVIKRLAKDPGLQSVFYTFPDKDEFATKDMFRKHPTIPNHWLFVGRKDDIVVLSNGENLNPLLIEETVMSHPSVVRALVVGSQRFQPALIIELKLTDLCPFPKSDEEKHAFIDELWPVIEEANKISPQYGKIERRFIAFADPEMPFPLSPKNSIQRGKALELYKDFIHQLYDRAEQEDGTGQEVVLNFESVGSLTESIVHLLKVKFDAVKATPETDLFDIGFDSLQVITFSHLLQSGIKAAGFPITKDTVNPRVVYANFVPKDLAEYLYSTLKDGHQQFSFGSFDARQVSMLGEFIEKYTSDLPAPNLGQTDPLDDGQTVLVTGTTGSLGAYMLSRLISNSRVKRIVALNRGSDGGASRQLAQNASRLLSMDLSKVEFHGVDLSLPMWGLSKDIYEGLLAKADRIIHSAWPVNFSVSIETLEPIIRGVRHLVDFSNKAAKRVPIIFITSVTTVENWSETSPVPEKRLEDLTLPTMGYGRSKAAASSILDAASKAAGVPTVSIRTGLIVGPRCEGGLWNKQEFIPSLVASSVYLGMLPDSIGPVDVIDWVPVEDVADIVLDLAGITEPRPVTDISGYFHCVNPNTSHWSSIALAIKDFYGERIQKIVSLAEWVDALEKSANDETIDPTKNPGVKLLFTYQAMLAAQRAGMPRVTFALERTKEYSRTMKNMKIAVDGDLMKRWCDQWQY